MFSNVFDDKKKQPEEIEIAPNANSLDLLQAVYRCNDLPLHTRMRAAMAALKHEIPALIATAVVNEQDFATLLDRRIANYERMQQQQRLIEAKAIEPPKSNGNTNSQAEPEPPIELRPEPPSSTLSRIYDNRRWPRRF